MIYNCPDCGALLKKKHISNRRCWRCESSSIVEAINSTNQQTKEENRTQKSGTFLSTTENKILMISARESLSGNWGLTARAFFLYFFILAFIGIIPIIGLVTHIIYGAFNLGIAGFYLKISRRGKAKISDIFKGFENFGTSIGMYLLSGVFVLLWSILLIIPGFIAALSYSQIYFIVNDDPTTGGFEAIKKSKRIMKGNKWKLFCLCCRFSGWIILCILTLGIGFFWLVPYAGVSFAKFYEDLNSNDRNLSNYDDKNNPANQNEINDEDPKTQKNIEYNENSNQERDYDIKEELKRHKELLDEGLITEEQYKLKSDEILGL